MEILYSINLNIPAYSIDMSKWIFSLSDSDYQACAKGHLAMGVLDDACGKGMINVETVGGVLLIQHYRVKEMDKHHFEFVSENTRAYIFHLIPITIAVRWAMRVETRSINTSQLTCEIGTHFGNPILAMGARLIGMPFFLRRHQIEETHGFTRNMTAVFHPSQI